MFHEYISRFLSIAVAMSLFVSASAMDHNQRSHSISHSSVQEEEQTCALCLESMQGTQPIIHLDCNFGCKGHSFHLDCLHSHIERGPKTSNILNKTVSRCPICNADTMCFDTRMGNKLYGMNRELTPDEAMKLRLIFGSIYVSMSQNKLNNQIPQINHDNTDDLQLTEEEKQFIATTSDKHVIDTLLSGMSDDELRLNGYAAANSGNGANESNNEPEELYYLCQCGNYHRADF